MSIFGRRDRRPAPLEWGSSFAEAEVVSRPRRGRRRHDATYDARIMASQPPSDHRPIGSRRRDIARQVLRQQDHDHRRRLQCREGPVGRDDLHETAMPSHEDLSELRVGVRSRGRFWIGAQWIHGLAAWSPSDGVRIAAGLDAVVERLPFFE